MHFPLSASPCHGGAQPRGQEPAARTLAYCSGALLLVSMLLASTSTFAADVGCKADSAVRVMVTVPNVRSDKGDIAVTLYPDNDDAWLKHRGQLGIVRMPARAPETTVCIAAPKAGEYALTVYHDENSDHDFNRNWMGLPTEGWGVSNNPGFWFVPSLDDALFHVPAGQSRVRMEVKLDY